MSCPRTIGLVGASTKRKIENKKKSEVALSLRHQKNEINREAPSEVMIIRAFDYNYKKIADLDFSYNQAVKV